MTDLFVVPQPGDPLGRCGATNPTLGLTCNREPHRPGSTHYQDVGNGVRAWTDQPPLSAWEILGIAPNWTGDLTTQQHMDQVRGRVPARPGNQPKERP
ncbi:hypothetical protein ACIBBG_33975 [Micromonospora chersina]|uniref:hypothetical protein n=1 Tax=Micromonospora chersina TaxID=47854 RepID=UPI003787CC49